MASRQGMIETLDVQELLDKNASRKDSWTIWCFPELPREKVSWMTKYFKRIVLKSIQHIKHVYWLRNLNAQLNVSYYNIKSDPPHGYYILEKCLDRLESTNGPLVYNSGEIQEYDPDMGLLISKEIPCKILFSINTKKFILNGLGCYYGNGHVLTALHVIESTDLAKGKILVAFTTGEIMLVYKADFTNSCNFDRGRDQTFIKLFGDTSPLGDGLQNQIGKTNDHGSVYCYTLDPDGNFQKQEGKILRPNLNMKAQMCTNEFIISVAGKPGDSGSPVYNTNDELIGIYRGSFTRPDIPEYEYGRFSEIPPGFIPWIQTNYCTYTDLIKDLFYYFCSFQQPFFDTYSKATPDLEMNDSCLVEIN